MQIIHSPNAPAAEPSWAALEPRFTVDYEEAACLGLPPLEAILALSGRLESGQVLRLNIPFEPILLRRVFESHGFQAWSRSGPTGKEIRFYKPPPTQLGTAAPFQNTKPTKEKPLCLPPKPSRPAGS